MRYLYKCKTCEVEVIVNKPMKDVSRDEKCSVCNNILTRQYSTPAISTGDGYKK